ncbi:hypothetical protein WJX72_005265 [[Myrmecia] bisecta]|uniref:N-acetyltransferase domain-containing protein n=1 Tax=[Myrmecia] bisecta TaxID=41462 RepID=A0AAW1Q3X8_9CHLO
MVWREKMNPLGLHPERFLVAQDANGAIKGFGQLEPKPSSTDAQFLELRTLIVDHSCRGQGVGSAVLQQLVDRATNKDIYLTTLRQTRSFYEPAGFKEVPLKEAPRSMMFEVAAGTLVARLAAGDALIVMRRQKT